MPLFFDRLPKSDPEASGRGLTLSVGLTETPFGQLLLAVSERGVALVEFCHDYTMSLRRLRSEWPEAEFSLELVEADAWGEQIIGSLQHPIEEPIPVILRGTDFQCDVWEAVARIPSGRTASYLDVATAVGRPHAYRATGSAIGKNRLGLLIPCHRVIASDGGIGGYFWGDDRKRSLLAHEGTTLGQ